MEQLVVLGMHRSGTSLVAGLVSMLGLHVGEESELLAPQPDNPKGFFERSDVIEINDAILAAQDATWDCPLGILKKRNLNHILEPAEEKIQKVVYALENRSPFLIKDPRFCLTIGTWQKYLNNPVYLFVYRDPIEVALSLHRRNRMPIAVGTALWEFYTVNLLRMIAGKEIIYADYQNAVTDPPDFLLNIKTKLEALGFAMHDNPDEDRVNEFVSRNQSTKKQASVSTEDYMTEASVRLANDVRAGDLGAKNVLLDVSGSSIDTLSIYPGIEAGAESRVALLQSLKDSARKISDLASAGTSDRKELVKLREKYGSLETEHLDLATAYKRDWNELTILREKYRNLERQHTALGAAHQHDTKKLEALKEKNHHLTESCTKLEDDIKEFGSKNTQLLGAIQLIENDLKEEKQRNRLLLNTNEQIRNALTSHQHSVLGRFFSAFSKLYKLITFRVGRPTALEFAVALARQHNGNELVRKFPSKTNFLFKFDLLLLLTRRMLFSPVRTVRAITFSRVKNFTTVLFGMPKHQASLIVSNAIQRYLEVAVEDVSLDEYRGELIHLEHANRPQVSILIPVYNKLSTTLNCIQSIYENTDFELNPYEIVFADDCSSDETKYISKYVQGIKHVRQPRNMGFLKNCNQAAKRCAGEFIVLLNNDTLVQKDWLPSLVGLMISDHKIGMVGPKFLFENGTLQEAGGIIWSDASGWNWGRGQDPALPEYNYIRDVDYISGACILLRKELWDELGGFDEEFSPAYYEDTDLAFRVRSTGYRVCYQPLSRVVHLEGVSNGTDVNSGVKRYQKVNREKFKLKWRDVLASSHFDNGKDVFLARERASARKTILVIDHYVPHYDRDAGSRCSYQYLKLFRKIGLKVIFLGDNFYPHEPYTTELESLGIEVLYGKWYAKNWQDWLKANGHYLDYVYLQRPHIVGKYLDVLQQLADRPRLIYFGHDLHFLRVMRQSEVEHSDKLIKEAENWKRQEFKIFEQVDVICYPSQHEVDVIKTISPRLNVRAVPLYVYDDLDPVVPDFAGRAGMMFVGGYGHPPNIDAVNWFVAEVFPLIVEQSPELTLTIVGSNPPDELKALQGSSIRMVGEVSDEELGELYNNIKAAIVPLRFGAGVKGKVLEAMSKGVPVVTTSIGAEGIPAAGTCLSVENTAVGFSEAVVEVIAEENVWNRMSTSGLRVVGKYFSEQYVTDKVFSEMGICNTPHETDNITPDIAEAI